ncbi:MAG: NADPH-dependent 7-cyano-7-deazaguanine reductase QueF [Cyanobacteria bacterium SIG31]|nr:NADPH-dependent 7-cyano-7-deazaguanine reductase QueF [Cyanobacteria bacterium SIG31]
MNNNDRTNEIASKHLGKKSSGSELYDPSLLVAVPRILNREQYSISNEKIPFAGYDVWHAYEFSCLTENGVPVTRVLKLKYNCNNEFLIESKSLKLYLNSFNMSKFGRNVDEALNICKKIIQKDLSEKLVTDVEVNFLNKKIKQISIFADFIDLMDYVDEDSILIESFKESPEYLKCIQTNEQKEHFLMFDSLRSNCRVTHQPDFGKAFIYYKSNKLIDEQSLVMYLTSFRSEYHFHEECCEMIFKRIADILDNDDELLVCALYTRRGGIDICPARWRVNTNYEQILSLLEMDTYASYGVSF